MMHRVLITALAATVLSGAAFAQVSLNPQKASSGNYQLEERHTQVLFAIKHLALTDFYGRFDKMHGELKFDPAHPDQSQISVLLDISSIDTPNTELNGELKDVFNVAQFPNATFKSTAIAMTGPNAGKITGDLTLNGITKPITLDVTFNGSRQNPMDNAAALGFAATAVIHRPDFKLDQMMWSSAVGEDVNLTINAMFEQKK